MVVYHVPHRVSTHVMFNPINQLIDYLNKHMIHPVKQEEPTGVFLFENRNPNCFTRTITDELRESLDAY